MTQAELKQIYIYLPEGYFAKRKTGRVIQGGSTGTGHMMTTVPGHGSKTFLLHRLIFLWHHGWLPALVDHRDRNPKNNRIENLRSGDYSSNAINRKRRKNTLFKYRGIAQHESSGRFYAQIRKHGVLTNLGTFDTQIAAARAYDRAAKKIHGAFACTNF